MNNFCYYKCLLFSRLLAKGNEYVVSAFRKDGMSIGKGCRIYSNISQSEPYLIKIGDNCTISTNVNFITHDASIGVYMGRNKFSDICGRIEIGNNCFVGQGTTILYGVTLPNNTLVAAGSVVTKSIKQQGCIVGGNPAKVIGTIDDYLKKNKDYFLSLHGLNNTRRRDVILNSGKLCVK